MNWIQKNGKGLLLCLVIAVPSWFIGKLFPVVGGAVIAIVAGMAVTVFWKEKRDFASGITFTSKKILQWAVILLGFGMNLGVVFQTGKQSLPIIVCTITTSLVIAFALHKAMDIPSKISTLVGVGSSICGGSAIAATAPVIDADDEEVAQAISVIFFFNVLAAILFPVFGQMIGFDTTSGEAFGIFAGTAVNDTSSVTAAASTWDSMWGLGSQTLDKAVTVKLTRTLAIIPITLVLAFLRTRQASGNDGKKVSMKQIFPFFILYFIAASVITTVAVQCGVSADIFAPLKTLSKFFIVLAMAAIGLNTDVVKLVKTGGRPLVMGACCWAGITAVSLLLQNVMGIW
ncbi:AraC family transcriptional regulator [Eubacterium sp. An11]|uniref:YeiH family protein n=1 Tax=Eubacterium sp. An11 TaxID=1965542 RepID=UPI000B39F77B|nr:YeiH family protein [Eubacterium sp. An11]OUQ68867.1 AraC family transcriptional regulator [Eubacterium sp. An11]